jgi:hypothetical protein
MGEKTLASLMIYDADKMSDARRRQIATWLRRQANFLVKEGAENKIAPRFRARYLLDEGTMRAEKGVEQHIKSNPARTPAAEAARG